MPLSTDIPLPRDTDPHFPNECVRCGVARPNSVYRVRATRAGLVGLLMPWQIWLFWLNWGVRVVEAPACADCASRLKSSYWRREAFEWFLIIALAVPVIWLITSHNVPFRKPVAYAAIIVLGLPWFVWRALHPPAFHATTMGDKIDYEFLDSELADKFAMMNADQRSR